MVWAILPLKDLVQAKSRLAGVLTPSERRALVQAMVEDVFTVLSEHGELQGVLVVSDDPSAELLAHKYGLEWVAERQFEGRGLNAAVSAATDHLAARGVSDAMVLHGDIPLIQRADLDALLARYAQADVDMVIAPDLAGSGTNVMVFPLGQRPVFHYGENSCQAHQHEGRARGLQVSLLHSDGLGLDVDSPEDLLNLYHHLQTAGQASHSATVVLGGDVEQRLCAIENSGLGVHPGEENHDAV
jgi:2-phospho-L-lactate guanylyltransferase